MRDLVVLLDNGHGEETAGKRSPKWLNMPQIFEWDYNRKLVKVIHEKLKAEGFNSIIVTPETYDVPLWKRTKRVREYEQIYGKKNCLTISVHLNAHDNPKVRGWEAFTYLNSSISDVYSKVFYEVAKEYLPKDFPIRTGGPKEDPDKDANFAILRDVAGPAILTESMFMTNKTDCKYLLSEEGFNTFVNIHVEAIKRIDNLN